MNRIIEKTGFYIQLYGVVLVLGWIGAFKFTHAEAKAIEPLVSNSPLMSWMYGIGTLQEVSNFIGIFEIITAILLALYPIQKNLGLIGGILNSLIFLSTLSFLATTPGSFVLVEGFLVPDAFILKDLVFLGAGLLIIGMSLSKK